MILLQIFANITDQFKYRGKQCGPYTASKTFWQTTNSDDIYFDWRFKG